jgi:hypothetical protein
MTEHIAAVAGLDAESAEWRRALAGTGPQREEAAAQLHGLLVRIAHGEVARRGPRLRLTDPELDDLAYQAAADALVAITSKLGQFRGESWFTTWAYKFVVFEVSAKIGRHFWRHPSVRLDAEGWERLPDRFGFDPRRRPNGGTCWPRCPRRQAAWQPHDPAVLASSPGNRTFFTDGRNEPDDPRSPGPNRRQCALAASGLQLQVVTAARGARSCSLPSSRRVAACNRRQPATRPATPTRSSATSDSSL